jgi:TP901 family phage tail tape measure protein
MFGSGTNTAAQLMVKVGADVQDAQRQLGSLSSSLQNMGSTVMKAGGMMSMATAPIAIMGVQAMNTAGEFEQAMNILSVAAKSSQTSFDDLSAAALAVGADTQLVGITASEAGDAMTAMYKAGMTTNQIFGDMQGYLEGTASLSGALRSAIDLAASSELNLAQATDVVSVAMNTFGLSAGEAGSIADILVRTADAGVASVGGLAESLRNVGPVANSMGIGLDTVTQALSLMAGRGIEGAEAGTQLKSMLLNMQRDTSDVVGTWQALGLSMYDATGTMKALPTIMSELEDAMAGMTMEQRNQIVQTLAGTYGLNAMNTLLAEGEEGWAAMGASIEGAAGVQETAAARTKGWKAALETLGGVVESIQIKALTPFLENVLTPMARKLSDLLSGVMTLDPQIVNMGIIFAALAVAAGPVLLMVGALATGLGVLLSPIGLIIAGVVALGVAFATNFGGIRDALQPAIDTIGIFIQAISDVIAGYEGWDVLDENLPVGPLKDFGMALLDVVDAVTEFIAYGTSLTGVFSPIADGLLNMSGLTTILGESFSNFVALLASTFTQITEIASTVLPLVAEIVTQIFGILIASVQENVGAIQGNLQAAWDSLTTLVNGALTAIGDIIQGVLGVVKTFLDAHGEDIKATLGDAWVRISAIIATVMEILNATIVPVFQGIAQFINDHGAEIQTILSSAWTIIKNIIDGALTLIEGIVNTAMAILKGDWEGAWEIIKDTVERLWENIKEIVNAATTALTTAIGVTLVTIYEWFVEKFEAVKAFLSGIDLAALGAQIIQGLINGVKSMAGALIDAASGVVQSAIEAAKNLLGMHSPSRVFREIGQNTIEGFILGVLDMTSEITEAINKAFTGPVRKAVQTLGIIADAMTRVMDAMQTLALYGGVQDLPSKLTKLIADIKLVVIQLQRLAEYFAVENSPIWSAKAVLDPLAQIFSNLDQIIDAFSKISELDVLDANIEKFVAQLKQFVPKLVNGIVAAAAEINLSGLPAAIIFSQAAGGILPILDGVADGLTAAMNFTPPKTDNTDAFVEAIRYFVASLQTMASQMELKVFDDAIKFAEAAGRIGSQMKAALEALAVAISFNAPQTDNTDAFVEAIRYFVASLQTMASQMELKVFDDAIKFAEAAGQIGSQMKAALEALAAAISFNVPKTDNTDAFISTLRSFVARLQTMASQMQWKTFDDAIKFAEAAGRIGSQMKSALEALAAAMSFSPPKTDNTDAFILAIRRFVARLQTMASQMQWKVFDDAIKFAEVAGRVGSQMKDALEGATTAMNYVAPEIDNTDAFFLAIRRFVARLQTMASQMQWKAFDDAIKFAEAAGRIVAGLKDGVAFLGSLVGYVGPAIDDMNRFMWDFQFLFERMGRWIAFVIGPLVVDIEDDVAALIIGLTGAMGEALGVLGGLVEYVSPAAFAIERFTNDLGMLMTDFANWISTSPAISIFKSIPAELMTTFQEALSSLEISIGVLDALVEYVSPGEAAINVFIADMGLLLTNFATWVMQSRSGPWLIMDVPEEMMAAFSSAMQAMESAIGVLAGLVDYVSPGAAAITAFTTDYQALFNSFATWARANFMGVAVEVVEEVGRVTGVVFQGLGNAVGVLQDLTYYVGPTTNNINRFMEDVEQVMIRLRDWATTNFTTTSLAFLTAFGATAQSVFSAIGAALSVMQGIANYTVTGSQFDLGLQRFNTNLIRMLQSWETWVLNVLSPQATLLTDAFAAQMQAIVNTLRSALELLMDLDQANLPTADELLAFLNAISALFIGVIGTFGVVLTQVGSMMINLGNQIASILQFVEQAVVSFGVNMQNQILGVFLNLGSLMWDRGDYIAGMFMSGMLRGMQNVNSINAITDAMLSLANQMRDVLMAAWGIHSPSRVAERIGEYFVLGLKKGLEDLYGLPGMVQDALDMEVNGSNILFETTPRRAYLTVQFEGAWQAGMTPAEESRITKSMVQELRRQGMYVLAN